MKYTVEATERFDDDINFYKRKKKFTHIEDDVNEIVKELENGNLVGDEITGLKLTEEKSTYKVRVANSNTKVGKSNGYRIIYYVIKEDFNILLLTIYYKKDRENISTKEIQQLINDLM